LRPAGQNQRGGRRADRKPSTAQPDKLLDAFDQRVSSVELDVGAEAEQFLHVQKSVFENAFLGGAAAFGEAHERDPLRLPCPSENRIHIVTMLTGFSARFSRRAPCDLPR